MTRQKQHGQSEPKAAAPRAPRSAACRRRRPASGTAKAPLRKSASCNAHPASAKRPAYKDLMRKLPAEPDAIDIGNALLRDELKFLLKQHGISYHKKGDPEKNSMKSKGEMASDLALALAEEHGGAPTSPQAKPPPPKKARAAPDVASPELEFASPEAPPPPPARPARPVVTGAPDTIQNLRNTLGIPLSLVISPARIEAAQVLSGAIGPKPKVYMLTGGSQSSSLYSQHLQQASLLRAQHTRGAAAGGGGGGRGGGVVWEGAAAFC